jgi:hypothetical protein
MSVIAVCLSVLRWVGSPTAFTIGFGLWLGVVVIIRVALPIVPRFQGGFAMPLITGLFSILYFYVVFLWELYWQTTNLGHTAFLPFVPIGLTWGIIGFHGVCLLKWAVDKTDALLQTKTPPATANPVNQTQRPDAASSAE